MAKLVPAEEDAALRRRLRRSLAAVVAGGAGAEAFDDAAAALDTLREAELGRRGRKGGAEGGGEEEEAVSVPAQFLCPISSRIMTDPVVVASGQVMTYFLCGCFLVWALRFLDASAVDFCFCFCQFLGRNCGQYPFWHSRL
jgi:hypothetical protein